MALGLHFHQLLRGFQWHFVQRFIIIIQPLNPYDHCTPMSWLFVVLSYISGHIGYWMDCPEIWYRHLCPLCGIITGDASIAAVYEANNCKTIPLASTVLCCLMWPCGEHQQYMCYVLVRVGIVSMFMWCFTIGRQKMYSKEFFTSSQ